MLAVIDERRIARNKPAPQAPSPAPSAPKTETTQATQFAAGLAAATSRR